jgi:hypothetical protein
MANTRSTDEAFGFRQKHASDDGRSSSSRWTARMAETPPPRPFAAWLVVRTFPLRTPLFWSAPSTRAKISLLLSLSYPLQPASLLSGKAFGVWIPRSPRPSPRTGSITTHCHRLHRSRSLTHPSSVHSPRRSRLLRITAPSDRFDST